MEPLKLKLHELVTIGAIIVSVTTAYVLLSADVDSVKTNVIELRNSIDAIQEEQYRVQFYLGAKEGWEMSQQDAEQLGRELARKPWRSRSKRLEAR